MKKKTRQKIILFLLAIIVAGTAMYVGSRFAAPKNSPTSTAAPSDETTANLSFIDDSISGESGDGSEYDVVIPSGSGSDQMPSAIGRLVSDWEAARKGICSLTIVDLRTRKLVISVRGGELMIPASNQKLLTAAFAIRRLGKDYKFATKVYWRDGQVIVVGDFDPLLGDPRMAEANRTNIYAQIDQWVAAIKSAAAGKAVSEIAVVSSLGSAGNFRPADWPRNQYSTWYAAPVAELNFNDNCYDVTFAAQGDSFVPAIVPASRYFSVANGTIKGARSQWSLQSSADESQIVIRGTVAKASSDPYSVAVANPPMIVARVLGERLAAAGVQFAGGFRMLTPSQTAVGSLAPIMTTSNSLSDAIVRADKTSLNMAAECIFLRAGDGTWKGSAKLMQQSLAQMLDEPQTSLVVADGSGLSRNNGVTSVAMVKLLTAMTQIDDDDVFVSSLAVCGVDGTMSRRLRAAPYKGRLIAKTGSISGVSTLSGYVLDQSGKPAYAYSILCNRVTDVAAAHRLQDTIGAMLVDASAK